MFLFISEIILIGFTKAWRFVSCTRNTTGKKSYVQRVFRCTEISQQYIFFVIESVTGLSSKIIYSENISAGKFTVNKKKYISHPLVLKLKKIHFFFLLGKTPEELSWEFFF